eukprot:scaffold1964_cov252-Isochrysis_galbana.AAC.6
MAREGARCLPQGIREHMAQRNGWLCFLAWAPPTGCPLVAAAPQAAEKKEELAKEVAKKEKLEAEVAETKQAIEAKVRRRGDGWGGRWQACIRASRKARRWVHRIPDGCTPSPRSACVRCCVACPGRASDRVCVHVTRPQRS